MVGADLSLSGIDGKARYGCSLPADLLPVELLDGDDRVEVPEGGRSATGRSVPCRAEADRLARPSRLQPHPRGTRWRDAGREGRRPADSGWRGRTQQGGGFHLRSGSSVGAPPLSSNGMETHSSGLDSGDHVAGRPSLTDVPRGSPITLAPAARTSARRADRTV